MVSKRLKAEIKINVFFLALYKLLRSSYSARTELIHFSLTYNQLTVFLSSAQLLNAEH